MSADYVHPESAPRSRPRPRGGRVARAAALALLAAMQWARAAAPAADLPPPPGIDAELARPPELGSYAPADPPALPESLRRPAPSASTGPSAPAAPTIPQARPSAAAPSDAATPPAADGLAHVRALLHAGRRDDAVLALETLRRQSPGLAIPADLRALLPARAGAS